jgi:hypothetical protein
MIRAKIYGDKCYWCQAPRIIQGLNGIGCSIVKNNEDIYDFIYCNNFQYDSVDTEFKNSAIEQEGFKIFNVLDIPPHIPDFPLEKLRNQLTKADIITTISEVVKKQLKDILDIESDVILNPIKDVFLFNYEYSHRDIRCLYVGRGLDSNKRPFLLEEIYSDIISIGPCGGIGKYIGLVDDSILNNLYNRSLIVALPSKFEGLGLTALEAMVCGSIPLVCSDNPNSILCPDFCICEPNTKDIALKYKDLLLNFKKYQQKILEEYSFIIQKKYSKYSIAENIINSFKKRKIN